MPPHRHRSIFDAPPDPPFRETAEAFLKAAAATLKPAILFTADLVQAYPKFFGRAVLAAFGVWGFLSLPHGRVPRPDFGQVFMASPVLAPPVSSAIPIETTPRTFRQVHPWTRSPTYGGIGVKWARAARPATLPAEACPQEPIARKANALKPEVRPGKRKPLFRNAL